MPKTKISLSRRKTNKSRCKRSKKIRDSWCLRRRKKMYEKLNVLTNPTKKEKRHLPILVESFTTMYGINSTTTDTERDLLDSDAECEYDIKPNLEILHNSTMDHSDSILESIKGTVSLTEVYVKEELQLDEELNFSTEEVDVNTMDMCREQLGIAFYLFSIFRLFTCSKCKMEIGVKEVPIGAPSTSAKIRQCEVCAIKEAKYTCPRCELRTCSLPCSKIHKMELPCNGERDQTRYIPIAKFTNMDLSSDYRLLENITRGVAVLRTNRNYNGQMPYHLHKLTNAASTHRTTLKFLPRNFAKRKQNTTRVNFRTNFISWHLNWIFTNADYLKIEDETVPETERLGSLVNKYLVEQEDDFLQEKLQYYQAAGLSGIRLFLKVEEKSGNKYHELDPLETLRDNLRNKVVIEFPVIHLVLKEHSHLYDVLDSDDETDTSRTTCNGNDIANRIIRSFEKEDTINSSLKNLLFISEKSEDDMSEDD
ncbi:hypothetical protein FQA39_LY17116 [Lamprigera yunnana]|nr:hypothetical protein FQA39_LY17116 [Lamprigera yunnana]